MERVADVLEFIVENKGEKNNRRKDGRWKEKGERRKESGRIGMRIMILTTLWHNCKLNPHSAGPPRSQSNSYHDKILHCVYSVCM